MQESKQQKSPPKQTKPEEHISTVLINPVQPVVDEHAMETIPSKSGVFRRLNKKSSGSRKSPTMLRKPHLNHQGVLIRKVPAPVSPSSNKRTVGDMAKHISEKKLKKHMELATAK
ncbi:unnamed protein product [Lactuca virosa]|uniref:Uncharacterized protein n=1 Tax=Lactuca virosa TaxID=75947 RepID=A0AAU9MLF1_9ASTR|nr:unnamed protein product [Lactuca virosa]